MIKVVSLFEKETDPNGVYVNTTSKAETDWQRDLSPFYLGPCPLYGCYQSQLMENGWQYSKVYSSHVDDSGNPTYKYWDWARDGWWSKTPQRYPMGKGVKPEFSFWKGQKLSYVEARKKIYIPLYSKAVIQTKGFEKLVELVNQGKDLYLKDYDAYDHVKLGMTLSQVMNNPNKKMGHAFVLMMLLTDDECLKECNFDL
jgi:hypothetical protein